MKKFFMLVAIAAMCIFSSTAQSFKKEGNNYYTSSHSTKMSKDSIITDFNWNNYTIIVRKEDGYSWVGRISKKSGKYYRAAVPEDIAKDVCNRLNIKYTYVKKSKNSTTSNYGSIGAND